VVWLLGLALAARLAVWLGGCWHPAALLTDHRVITGLAPAR